MSRRKILDTITDLRQMVERGTESEGSNARSAIKRYRDKYSITDQELRRHKDHRYDKVRLVPIPKRWFLQITHIISDHYGCSAGGDLNHATIRGRKEQTRRAFQMVVRVAMRLINRLEDVPREARESWAEGYVSALHETLEGLRGQDSLLFHHVRFPSGLPVLRWGDPADEVARRIKEEDKASAPATEEQEEAMEKGVVDSSKLEQGYEAAKEEIPQFFL